MEIKNGVDEAKIVWEQFTSEKGVKYEIGHLDDSSEPFEVEGKLQSANGKSDFGVICNWVPTLNKEWKMTDHEFSSTTGISQYSVNQRSGIYKYIIHFSNDLPYDYYFYDETGDSYRCNTYKMRDHWVRYNSSQPNIIFIKGK